MEKQKVKQINALLPAKTLKQSNTFKLLTEMKCTKKLLTSPLLIVAIIDLLPWVLNTTVF